MPHWSFLKATTGTGATATRAMISVTTCASHLKGVVAISRWVWFRESFRNRTCTSRLGQLRPPAHRVVWRRSRQCRCSRAREGGYESPELGVPRRGATVERGYSEPPNCARSSSVNSVVRLLLPDAVMLYSCELHVLHNLSPSPQKKVTGACGAVRPDGVLGRSALSRPEYQRVEQLRTRRGGPPRSRRLPRQSVH